MKGVRFEDLTFGGDRTRSPEPKLGGYSNDPETHADELTSARSGVTHDVGDYVLTLHPRWMLYEATAKNGGRVPPALSGKWTDVASFRTAAAKFGKSR